MTIPMIRVPASRVVIVVRVERGNKIGTCQACEAIGWLVWPYGYPAHSTSGVASELTHKDECPMNDVLDDEGNIIED